MQPSLFQSAPAIAGGRCRIPVGVFVNNEKFQSAPAIAGGRCQGAGGHTRASKRFNPRPPLLAGDAAKPYLCPAGVAVSIRARHCWRAMRAMTGDVVNGYEGSIRARHCWRAMRLDPVRSLGAFRFQSAPAIAGGRCQPQRRA